jgi:NAD-dependent dihydropyrimidine dehydrogenase PreA subunit
MTYVVTAACIDVLDRSCIDECPVDCIYEGDRKMYLHPTECIDCGACEPVCPVDAIVWERRVLPSEHAHIEDNVRFFTEVLDGRDDPLGDPGGSFNVGRVGVDTEMVRLLPSSPTA